MMLEVIQRVQPCHTDFQDEDGHWFSLRITPYRTQDNRIDGVVLTAVDRNSADTGGIAAANSAAPKKSAKKAPRKTRG